eukprot:TRINITY_DN5634_c0_g1_i2.p1 TRINITY_DN5634_c0_g1~~TRINITY_DN5634_c0_g1_i2.p1  ORF type:complete len:350 (+),score=55.65 TRINITY_DN5634_c0_g1_i2:13-1062(+)
MRTNIGLGLLLIILLNSVNVFSESAKFNYSSFDRALKRHVVPGMIKGVPQNLVDYNELSQDPDFIMFFYQLGDFDISDPLDHNEYYAFWLNLHNYIALLTITNNPCKTDMFGYCGPITSILQTYEQQPSFFTPFWRTKKGLPIVGNNGTQWSIEEVQNMIRVHGIPPNVAKKYKTSFEEDLRALACLSFSSVSSPDILPFAFTSDKINEQLDYCNEQLLKNEFKGLKIDYEKSIVYLSSIYLYFNMDYYANKEQLVQLLSQFVYNETKEYLDTQEYSIRYMKFDWELNILPGDNICCAKDRMCIPWWTLVAGVMLIFIISFVVCIVRGDKSDIRIRKYSRRSRKYRSIK